MTCTSLAAPDLLGKPTAHFATRRKCVSNTHNTHTHTSPLLPPNKPQRQREIPVTKIQLKQLICTDISSRALERCTAEPLLHYTTHTALLPHQAGQPWGRDTGVVCSFTVAVGLSNCTPGVLKLNMGAELQNKAAGINFPCFNLWRHGTVCHCVFFRAKVFCLPQHKHLEIKLSSGASWVYRFDVQF